VRSEGETEREAGREDQLAGAQSMIDIRLRTQISDLELEGKVGKILTDDDYNLLVTRDCFIRKPNGAPLAVYRRGIVPQKLLDNAYPALHSLQQVTENRGLASGTQRVPRFPGSKRTSTLRFVKSSIIGSFDPAGQSPFCRLTAWTGRETEKWHTIHPLLRYVGERFEKEVPERYAKQVEYCRRTAPDWVIEGTPFTTVTVNNTYPTGVHTDKGDLDEGFSNLLVLRRGGSYQGGFLTFPRYRVAVNMREGDLLLMDAHEWHGNTAMVCGCGNVLKDACPTCGAERISVVAYYRTNMVKCGTAADEAEKHRVFIEQRQAASVGQ
jgi:Oxygenase domain of the 2OGFeDO superfamily